MSIYNYTAWWRRFLATCCHLRFDKTGMGQTKSEQADRQQEQADERGVFCAGCQTQLCGRDQAMEYAGGHRHVFINPAHLEFEIALYRQVVCLRSGPMTLAYTWFAGYAWQNILCANCHRHLGWRYQKVDSPDFYGLITERILER